MATSSFEKSFTVRPEKADEFIEEMTRAVPPTLPKDFQSRLVYLSQNGKLKDMVSRALNASPVGRSWDKVS